MDHHHTGLHWDYSSTPTQQNTWIPPQPVKKRPISDSECDDVYSEESSKEHYDIVSPERSSNGESDSCQLLSRKRRRGVIEKKRRDKINSSLSELKRLVPTAYEKQGSAKLEKAEILQLTVDHLKTLHTKGIDSMSIDSQRYALEYNIIGLRECVAEVSRYLVTIEGMDIQDPLRLRLMSHLQCFVAQREISAKNGASSSNWIPSAYQSVPSAAAYGPPLPPPPASSSPSATYHQNYLSSQPSTSSSTPSSNTSYIPNLSSSTHPTSPIHHQHCNTSVPPLSTTTTTNTTALQSSHAPSTSSHHHAHHQHHNLHHDGYPPHTNQYPITHDTQQGWIYTDLSSSRGSLSTLGYPQYPSTSGQGYPPHSGSLAAGSNNGNPMKPYRPWGAEMAY